MSSTVATHYTFRSTRGRLTTITTFPPRRVRGLLDGKAHKSVPMIQTSNGRGLTSTSMISRAYAAEILQFRTLVNFTREVQRS